MPLFHLSTTQLLWTPYWDFIISKSWLENISLNTEWDQCLHRPPPPPPPPLLNSSMTSSSTSEAKTLVVASFLNSTSPSQTPESTLFLTTRILKRERIWNQNYCEQLNSLVFPLLFSPKLISHLAGVLESLFTSWTAAKLMDRWLFPYFTTLTRRLCVIRRMVIEKLCIQLQKEDFPEEKGWNMCYPTGWLYWPKLQIYLDGIPKISGYFLSSFSFADFLINHFRKLVTFINKDDKDVKFIQNTQILT